MKQGQESFKQLRRLLSDDDRKFTERCNATVNSLVPKTWKMELFPRGEMADNRE